MACIRGVSAVPTSAAVANKLPGSWLVSVRTANKRVFTTTYPSLRDVYLGVGGILGIFEEGGLYVAIHDLR